MVHWAWEAYYESEGSPDSAMIDLQRTTAEGAPLEPKLQSSTNLVLPSEGSAASPLQLFKSVVASLESTRAAPFFSAAINDPRSAKSKAGLFEKNLV